MHLSLRLGFFIVKPGNFCMLLSCGWDKRVPSVKVTESGHRRCFTLLAPCPCQTCSQSMGGIPGWDHNCIILNGIYWKKRCLLKFEWNKNDWRCLVGSGLGCLCQGPWAEQKVLIFCCVTVCFWCTAYVGGRKACCRHGHCFIGILQDACGQHSCEESLGDVS